MRKFLSSSAGASFHVLSPLIRGGNKAGISALEVDVPKDQPLLRCISKEVCNAALLLVNKNLKMYTALGLWTLATEGTQELQKNPPFPAWKSDLDELWN